jgi:hypothetical protein
MKSCYLCEKSATSKEHVPAKCFFPDDSSYRKQLITVPSCEKHNEGTSADDEYVRNMISGFVLNNNVSFQQFFAKVVKSVMLNRGAAGILKKIKTDKGFVKGIQIDRSRFDKIIRKISYALFYKEFKTQWNRKLIVLSRHLLFEDLKSDNFAKIIDFAERNLPPLIEEGENPKVFKYSMLKDKNNIQNSMIRMTFYEGFTCWIIVEENTTHNEL